MIYLFVALKIEATPIINYYKLKKVKFNIFENSQMKLLICGIGEKNFSLSCGELEISENDEVINFGICGSCTPNLQIGEMINISKIQNDKISFTLQNSPNLKNLTLQTFHNPVTKNINFSCDVVDMEGFVFYQIFQNLTNNIKIIKVVSDYLDTTIPKKNFIYGLINKKMAILNEEIYGK